MNARRAAIALIVLAAWLYGLLTASAQPPPGLITATTQRDERTWIGSTEGLWRLDGERLTPVELPFLDDHITALYDDGSALWVGTYGAIGRYSPPGVWQQWQRGDAGLTSAWAKAFTTYQGETVVGTYDRGVFRWDGQGWQALGNAPPFVTALAADGSTLYAKGADDAYRFDGGAWLAAPELSDALAPARYTATLPESTALERPVILVHGLGDSNRLGQSNLRFLARWLKSDGFPVFYVEYSPSAPLHVNAGRVADQVAAAHRAYPERAPVVIAHSYGGLLARTYAALYPGEIGGLITLGTPHAGVRLAYDFVVPDLDTSAAPHWRELLPEHTELLEPYLSSEQIPQLHVAGDLLPRENFFEGFGPHDGVVDAASAVAAPGATRVLPLLHGWTTATLRYGIDSYLYPKTLYHTTLRPFLAALDGTPPTDRAATALLAAPGLTHRPLFAGTLEPGETRGLTVTVDATPATWFLDGAGVEMTLVSPDGRRYEGDRTGVGGTVSHLPYRDSILQPVDLWSTETAGLWRVELTSRQRRSSPVRLTIVQPQGPALEVEVTTPWVETGQEVLVEARSTSGQRLTAQIGTSEWEFTESAPGLYRAALTSPEAPGYHALRVSNGADARWRVVTVRSARFQAGAAEVAAGEARLTLRLPVSGSGAIALGMRIIAGDDTIATRFHRQQIDGSGVVTLDVPVPAGAGPVRVEWQLFDARGVLIPVTLTAP